MFDDNTPNNNMADNGNADDNKTDYDPNPIVIDDQELDMVINLEGDMDGDGEAQR
jgi:hypothetical protein